MAVVGIRLRDVPSTIGWDGLSMLLRNSPRFEAYRMAKSPEFEEFGCQLRQSAMLADIYDAVMSVAYIAAKGMGGSPQKPRPMPRPWLSDAGQTVGSDAIPVGDFDDWYYNG